MTAITRRLARESSPAVRAHEHIHNTPDAATADRGARCSYRRPTLTAREIEILTSWLRCDSKPAVAADMFLSLGTVNTHLTRIRQKYAAVGRPAPTKASLVARALQDGLVDINEL
jgi:DNA-binding CsgD family transcriptional regulator